VPESLFFALLLVCGFVFLRIPALFADFMTFLSQKYRFLINFNELFILFRLNICKCAALYFEWVFKRAGCMN